MDTEESWNGTVANASINNFIAKPFPPLHPQSLGHPFLNFTSRADENIINIFWDFWEAFHRRIAEKDSNISYALYSMVVTYCFWSIYRQVFIYPKGEPLCNRCLRLSITAVSACWDRHTQPMNWSHIYLILDIDHFIFDCFWYTLTFMY